MKQKRTYCTGSNFSNVPDFVREMHRYRIVNITATSARWACPSNDIEGREHRLD